MVIINMSEIQSLLEKGIVDSILKIQCIHCRTDLDIMHKSNKSEFETKWIEVIGEKDKNIVIGVVYRHPKSKDKEFMIV